MNKLDCKSAQIKSTTIAQKAIWMGQVMEPENAAYNVGVRIDLVGKVDTGALEKAIDKTAREIDSLNATFTLLDEKSNELVQIINIENYEVINFIDCSNKIKTEEEVYSYMNKDLSTPIDLASDKLYCFKLFKISDSKYSLYFRCHHIVLDGCGVALLFQRIAHIYNAYVSFSNISDSWFESQQLPVEDENNYHNSDKYKLDQKFWLSYMSNLKEVVSFVSKSTFPSSKILRKDIFIPAQNVELIYKIANKHKTNSAFIVLAAVTNYIRQVTHSDEVVIGVPMMGRINFRSMKVPTTLTNILPLRLKLDAMTNSSQIINLVVAEMAKIRHHQYYRAEKLRQQLKLTGNNRRLVGPTFNIDVFPTELDLVNCQTNICTLSPGPIDDFAITLQTKRKDGNIPLLTMANSRTYSSNEFNRHSEGLYDSLINFIDKLL